MFLNGGRNGMAIIIKEQAVFFFRLLLACVCGGVIGIERQQRTKIAGTRTHIILALATSLMMIISKYGFFDVVGVQGITMDASRVAAGIISGIGILGGVIIITGRQGYVSGITTVVGLWATLGIGMAIGAGMYALGVGTTLIILGLQWLLHKNLWIVKKPTRVQVRIKLDNNRQAYEKVAGELSKYKISMYQIKFHRKGGGDFQMHCEAMVPARFSREEIVEIFMGMEEVETFEIM